MIIGEIAQPLFSDETWYGILKMEPSLANKETVERLLGYIVFCAKWNDRFADNPESPPDTAEFKKFADLVQSREWCIHDDQEAISHEVGCPCFLGGSEFSCRSRKWLDSSQEHRSM
jgi:hypothetical protein